MEKNILTFCKDYEKKNNLLYFEMEHSIDLCVITATIYVMGIFSEYLGNMSQESFTVMIALCTCFIVGIMSFSRDFIEILMKKIKV